MDFNNLKIYIDVTLIKQRSFFVNFPREWCAEGILQSNLGRTAVANEKDPPYLTIYVFPPLGKELRFFILVFILDRISL